MKKKHEIEQKSMAKERKEEKMISKRTAIAIKYTKCFEKKI